MLQVTRSYMMARYDGGEFGQAANGRMISLSTNTEGALKVSMTGATGYDPIVTSTGEMGVYIAQNGVVADVAAPADAVTASPLTGLATRSVIMKYNGSTYDRERNNHALTALASAARTASVNSSDLTNYNALGGHFIIDVTAIAATPSIVVTIQGKDALSGKYYDLLVGVAITATGTTVLKVHPGITGVANAAANDILPRIFRVSVANADTDSITYSVGVNLVA